MLKKIFNQKNNRAIVCAVYAIIVACTLSFIFGNSFAGKEDSAAQSDKVVQIVRPIIDPNHTMKDEDVSFIVRKSAHFAEFCLLGFELSLFVFYISGGFDLRRTAFAAFTALLVANIDEYIQIHSDRGSSVADVFIDLGGALFGIAVGIAVSYAARGIYRRLRERAAAKKAAAVI